MLEFAAVFRPQRPLGASLALLLIAAGCTKAGTATNGRVNAWTHPHILIYASGGDINTLNPHLSQMIEVGRIGQLTMAWLTRVGSRNQIVPELATEVPTATNGGVSKDGLTITYHLRKGVKWSDGAPFDADDVVFSTKVVLNPANDEAGRQGWDRIVRIDEPDKSTIVYHLNKPYSPFVETFFSTAGANPCILPKHLLAQYRNINNVPYNSLPVGIGPFKVKRWDRGEQVLLEANEMYWRGRPKLDRIVFKVIPDRNTLLSQMEAHQLDMWDLATGNYLARASAIDGYTRLEVPSYSWEHVDFNLTNPILKDPTVRQALRLGWNRRARLEKIAHGLGTLADSPTPITAPYTVSKPLVPYDPSRANKILDSDGWKIAADGVRERNGQRMSFTFAVYSGAPDTDNDIELLRSDWRKIGVTFNVKHYPVQQFFAPLQEGGIAYSSNKWDIETFWWASDVIGDYSPIYGCDAFPPNGQNNVRWCNATANAAMQSLYRHYDQGSRNADVKTIVDEFYNDVPAVVQDQRIDVYVYNKDLKNFHPNSTTPFDDFMNVDV